MICEGCHNFSLFVFPKQIEPPLYSKLFQKNLDPDVFNQIIKILHDFYIEEEPSLIFEILQRLPELKRFDMAVMFMSEPEKKSKFLEESFSVSLFWLVPLLNK